MSLPALLQGRLTLPLISAPMFLVSGPDLVIEACKAGIVGTFPALNQRSSEAFEAWLVQIKQALQTFEADTGKQAAPFGVNLIVHKTNPRLQADLEICKRHQVPLIITSLGAVPDVVETVHGYGGLVFHDVATVRHAQKAAEAGVDGLIAVCAGAGGHAGILSPFALVSEIRQFYHGTVILSGCLSTGRDIATAQMLGADLAYMGTRFINTQESKAVADYQQMIVDSSASDITYTPEISGIPANFLKKSLAVAGLDPNTGKAITEEVADSQKSGSKELNLGEELTAPKDGASAWKSIWSAGQGVGSVHDVPSVAALVATLHEEYVSATIEYAQLSREYALKIQGGF
ncbi:NAD(P)H-dependent flavin oxidoreductase [Neptunomonas antarctica]|uniref:Nitronate monooxygenase n=1 Tax=Neptunomonas antarctica TaxID=619304 RepID=A0A1N7N7L2_9GAMM|nr:nitronate monooxygenase [Neptunomonas antarctica]SIS94316.1 nitronate monooxygenase [Neptunomonas antarctica]